MTQDGLPDKPITVGSWGSEPPPILYRITLRGDFSILENIVVDHNKDSGDAVRVRGAANCILRSLEVKNGISDGIDVGGGKNVYDAEIAFRIRGTLGNANTRISNTVIYDVEKAILAENDLSNLVVYNSTFGDGIIEQIDFSGGSAGVGTWDWRNNAFIGSIPSNAEVSTNLLAKHSDFINAAQRDYHLSPDSALVDKGEFISTVSQDRDGMQRSGVYDIGAYELHGSDNVPPAPPGNMRRSEQP